MSPTFPTCSEVRKVNESWLCLDLLHLFCLFPVLHEGTPWTHLHFHLATAWQKAQTTYKKNKISMLPPRTSIVMKSCVAPYEGDSGSETSFQFWSSMEGYTSSNVSSSPWISLSLYSYAASNIVSSQNPPGKSLLFKIPISVDCRAVDFLCWVLRYNIPPSHNSFSQSYVDPWICRQSVLPSIFLIHPMIYLLWFLWLVWGKFQPPIFFHEDAQFF